MTLLKIKYFIDVANLESFTKAAGYNYVSQTAVSQQISGIEQELGVQLFIREKGVVKLTQAGESFYRDCVRIMAEYEKAVANVQAIHNKKCGVITLGILTTCRMDYLYDIFKEFHKRCPNYEIRMVQSSFVSLRQQLESGELDAGLAGSYNMQEIENVQLEKMTQFKMGLLVSKDNPLSYYDEISAKMAATQNIVMSSRKFSGKIYDRMLEQRKIDGFVPKIVETADSTEVLVMLVEMNRGCAYLPELTTKYNRDLCKMLHIYDNEDYLEFSLAWQKNNTGEALETFVQCVREFFEMEIDEWLEANGPYSEHQRHFQAGG